MKYGLNYQGSKNGIVKELCDVLPIRRNFYDLFGGGGTVTHRMLHLDRYERYIMCDVNPLPLLLFSDCVHGRVPEPRWVSHKLFDETKSTDAYAACCFCFGGDWQTYAYSAESEPFKKAMHYAILYLDFSYADAMGMDLRGLEKYPNWHQRRLALKDVAKRSDRLCEIQHLQRHASLEYLEGLVGLSKMAEFEQLDRFVTVCLPYNEVDILEDSLLYCDPPYRSTHKYTTGEFDHEAFYEWCRRQTELVVVSEYDMPDDFVCVRQFPRFQSKGYLNRSTVMEKLFVPRHQIGMYEDSKTELF